MNLDSMLEILMYKKDMVKHQSHISAMPQVTKPKKIEEPLYVAYFLKRNNWQQ